MKQQYYIYKFTDGQYYFQSTGYTDYDVKEIRENLGDDYIVLVRAEPPRVVQHISFFTVFGLDLVQQL